MGRRVRLVDASSLCKCSACPSSAGYVLSDCRQWSDRFGLVRASDAVPAIVLAFGPFGPPVAIGCCHRITLCSPLGRGANWHDGDRQWTDCGVHRIESARVVGSAGRDPGARQHRIARSSDRSSRLRDERRPEHVDLARRPSSQRERVGKHPTQRDSVGKHRARRNFARRGIGPIRWRRHRRDDPHHHPGSSPR